MRTDGDRFLPVPEAEVAARLARRERAIWTARVGALHRGPWPGRKFKGTTWLRRERVWRAKLTLGGRSWTRRAPTAEAAARAYDALLDGHVASSLKPYRNFPNPA